MSTMNDLVAQRQRLAERLARIDAERMKITEELAELEAAERVLSRLSPRAASKRRAGRPQKAVSAKPAKPLARRANAVRGVQKQAATPKLPLGDATLRAVKALGKEVSAEQIRSYLGSKFGMRVQPHHLGRALQRHQVGGRLNQRNERWSMVKATNGASAPA